jgi:hypothetical protein
MWSLRTKPLQTFDPGGPILPYDNIITVMIMEITVREYKQKISLYAQYIMLSEHLAMLSYPCNRPWSPIGLWDVEAPTSSRRSAHRWRWSCQPYAPSYPCTMPWRPIGLWDVEASTLSRQSAHRRQCGCQPCAPSYPCTRLWKPIWLWDVEAPTSSRQSAHRWLWGCQPYGLLALYPQEDFCYSFLLEAESTPGP